jgi:oligopeptide transport system substrate-binding protein
MIKILILLPGLLVLLSPAYAEVAINLVKPENGFTFRIPDEPETLDWNRAHTAIEPNILMNIMEGLVTFGANYSVEPALAESWTISADEKVYTFKLRHHVQWSDGFFLKAQDFVESWKRLLSPITAAAYAYLLHDIVGAEDYSKGKIKDFDKVGSKALDERTFQVTIA